MLDELSTPVSSPVSLFFSSLNRERGVDDDFGGELSLGEVAFFLCSLPCVLLDEVCDFDLLDPEALAMEVDFGASFTASLLLLLVLLAPPPRPCSEDPGDPKYDPQNESPAPQVEPNMLEEPLLSVAGVDLSLCAFSGCWICSVRDGLNHVDRVSVDLARGSGVVCILIEEAASLEVVEGGEAAELVDTDTSFTARKPVECVMKLGFLLKAHQGYNLSKIIRQNF